MMKRLISLVLMLMMLVSTGCAQEVLQEIIMTRDENVDRIYTISPAQCDTDMLCELTFGEQAEQAVLEEREYGYQHYHLPESNGVPFCGAGANHYLFHGMQAYISIYRYTGDEYQFSLSANVYPDGRLPEGMITAEEAREMANPIPSALGLSGAEYLSTIAYGRVTDSVPGYKITYLQKLNSRPLYWGAAPATSDADLQPSTNLLEVIVAGTNGELLRASGQWSQLTPAGEPQAVIAWQTAQEAFLKLGVDPQNMERCYWMKPYADESGPKAYPAYRVKNTFLNALTGEWLQIDAL